MAFPTFSISVLPGSLTAIFTDTSTYGVAPAPLQSEITAAVLTMSLPDPVSFLPDNSNTTTVDLYALGFPFTNPITFTSVDFGQLLVTDKIPDGVYFFSLLVTFDTGSGEETITGTWYGFVYKQAECCSDGMTNQRGCGCSDCLTQTEINILKMRLDFFSISLNQTYCQDPIAAAAAILDATEICEGSCKTCCCD